MEDMTRPLPAPKICCCIPVDTACLVFAVMTMMKWGFLAVIMALYTVSEPMAIIIFLFVLIPFVFSILLFKGVQERRPDYLKIYMIYAIAIKTLLVFLIFIYVVYTKDIGGGCSFLIIIGIYSLHIIMVKRTYDLFRAEQSRITALLEAPPKVYHTMEPSAPVPTEP